MTYWDPVVSRPQVHTRGEVTAETADYAVRKLQAALHHAPAPVLRSWLSLDAATADGNRIDVHIDVNGVSLHVHAVGSTMAEAADAVQDRLRSRLRRMRRRPAQGPPPPAGADDLEKGLSALLPEAWPAG